MNTEQAKQLIHNTFDYPFEEHKFTNFIDDLLIDVDFNESFGYIPPSQNQFKTHVKEYSKVGQYTDPEGEVIDILTAKLHNSYSLEKSRTTLRNFVAEYLKNSIESDGCLIAFNVDGYEDWRFSYIKLQYDLEADSETGKTKAVQKLTPAKRYSFLVGKNEPNHTAQAQILPLLAKPEKPTLKDIEESFSVDKVTKQFYEDYRKLFEDLSKELNRIVESDSAIKSDFDKHSIEVDNFSKKLLGQIVFLYFLQKKGWLGITRNSEGKYGDWGSGKKDFMRRLYNKEYCEYDNFFNDVLEHLFYNGLGSENSGDVYSKLNSKIPFLNGGLFSPINDYNWQETDIVIENKFIENILDTFDKYNFTVREDNPLDKEVAIDPEMLGRVFENLLPENIRKGKGAFYTPRTIVHYMCQESLINYLDTECENIDIDKIRDLILNNSKAYTLSDSELEKIDSKLHDVKICDPAIGSGAFPVGMMNEIIKARVYASEKLNKEYTIYDLKRHCISESIYGVDLDPGAIEIAKLRLWLSLIVDEDDYHNIQSLPNLDFKIMQGNSLKEDFHGISLDIEKKEGEQTGIFEGGQELDRLIDDLHDKQLAFLESNHPNEKKKLKEKVEQSIYNIFDSEIKKVTGISKEEKQKMSNDLLEMTHGNKIRNFFPWKLYFADIFREKGGFDILIANPPYVPITKIDKLDRKLFVEKFKFAVGRFNLFYFFLELTGQVTKYNGVSNFIVPDRLLLNTQVSKLRNWLLNKNQIIEIVSFDETIFEAVVDSILISFKKSTKNYNQINVKNNIQSNQIQNSNNIMVPVEYFASSHSYQFNLNYDKNKYALFKKIKNQSLEMDTISETKDGVIQGAISDTLFLSEPIDKYSMKLLFGKDINKYSLTFNSNWINYKREDMMKLEKSRVGKSPGLRMRNEDIFEKEKILTRQTADRIIGSLDSEYHYYSNTLHGTSIIDKNFDIKFVLAFLNCSLVNWFYKSTTSEGGKVFAQVKIALLRKLPIYKCSKEEQQPIIDLVDNILSIKKSNANSDTTKLENKIDQIIYKLYELTEEEIQIVESSVD